MPKSRRENKVNLDTRTQLIFSLPFFSTFTVNECRALAKHFEEIKFKPKETIVEEGELIDSIFIIVSGLAEVRKKIFERKKLIKKRKVKYIPIATLHPQESIGLNDTGFYSTTAKRTATVVTLTDMVLLRLKLKDLKQFFEIYPHLQNNFYLATEKMLRMQLIKESLPFSRLSYERLEWLVNHVEEMNVAPGTVLFKQGEIGDCCYLIRSGQIEIVARENDQAEHTLAILKAPMLFGEATLITNTPRNATARALKPTQLLVLPHLYLIELLESEKNVTEMFMTLMVDRSRPLKNPNVKAHHRFTADREEVIILKNLSNGNYFKLSQEGWHIWQQLDGTQTMQEITLDLADKFNRFAPDVVVALISKLAKGGFLQNLEVREAPTENQPLWIRLMFKIRQILEARIAIGNANQWLTPLYKSFAHYLFTRIGKIILSIIALSGIFAFAFTTPLVFESLSREHDILFLLILLIPFAVLSTAFHELGHALATKSFGFEVRYMGIGWYWFGPVAFTDTSDMWLGARWPRILVNLAGIFTDLLIAGVASILIYVIPNAYIQCFLWLVALYNYLNAFRMLSPLQDLDGYYVLMDLFERPRLRHAAVLWLIHDFPKALRHPKLFYKKRAEVTYWGMCLLFLILVTIITFIIQSFVFELLGIQSTSLLLSLCLPFIVVLISSLGIIADIRSQVKD